MSDLLTSASILLATLVALFGIFYNDISETFTMMLQCQKINGASDQDTNEHNREAVLKNRNIAIRDYNREHYSKGIAIRKSKLWPLLGLTVLTTIVYAPACGELIYNAIVIYNKNGICLKYYNTVNAAFILVFIFMLLLSAFLLRENLKFYQQLRRINPNRMSQ